MYLLIFALFTNGTNIVNFEWSRKQLQIMIYSFFAYPVSSDLL